MCLGAVVMVDVPHIIYALHDQVVHSKTTIEAIHMCGVTLKAIMEGCWKMNLQKYLKSTDQRI